MNWYNNFMLFLLIIFSVSMFMLIHNNNKKSNLKKEYNSLIINTLSLYIFFICQSLEEYVLYKYYTSIMKNNLFDNKDFDYYTNLSKEHYEYHHEYKKYLNYHITNLSYYFSKISYLYNIKNPFSLESFIRINHYNQEIRNYLSSFDKCKSISDANMHLEKRIKIFKSYSQDIELKLNPLIKELNNKGIPIKIIQHI